MHSESFRDVLVQELGLPKFPDRVDDFRSLIRSAFTPGTARRYLTTDEAARYTNSSTSKLEKLRCSGGGPLYVKFGRSVMYRVDDLDAYLDGLRVEHTSEAA